MSGRKTARAASAPLRHPASSENRTRDLTGKAGIVVITGSCFSKIVGPQQSAGNTLAALNTTRLKERVMPEITISKATRTINEKDVERFWSKVDKDGPTPAHMPHLGKCWIWNGDIRPSRSGEYGDIRVRGKHIRAHRAAWMIERGPIPDNFVVGHECDNPRCVNPLHLFIGTQRENILDMNKKGRQARGEWNGNSTFSEDEIRSIRTRYSNGETQKEIGATFGVRQTTISRIVTGRSWKHIPVIGKSWKPCGVEIK